MSEKFDMEDLSCWEVMEAEKVSGISISQMEQGGPGTTALVVALRWQFAKRLNPNLDFQSFARDLKLVDLNVAEEDE
ncbi:hypothetical protein [Rhodococcus wratislaviensis]|uniref:hypothetical protein n=1 Tax=Rhodococcus wratislaviensis TaxID=44752 RepID=UPI0011C041DF|nr:hypothetical protein [Rhodococcus wratislaviensis]